MSIGELDREQRSRQDEFSRTPPQDLVAEESVLGGMMLSKDAIADVVEVLKGNDFYRPAHENIYDAIVTLYGKGEPADAVTVADELNKRGELSRIGGPAYLHTLISSVPTAANAGFYAEIVRERAVLRRLVDAGTKIVQLGYSNDGEVEDLVNAAQAEIFSVADTRANEDYLPLQAIMEHTIDEIESASGRGEGMLGVPTGFYEFDELTHGLQPGQMIVIAARPAVGKSTFALDIARSAAIKHELPTVVFSLEMSRNEIAMRILSAEATINLQDLRKGSLRQEHWTKIAAVSQRLNDAPLFIDDSPNMSLMEIRAKCRRLKQNHGLKLVVLDYLQLMSSGKRVESRQQEVSEFSRALKLLAKELEIPVIALSQLNRGSEQRTDKRPMVSDLRESGCLTADTRILRSDTGAETTMGELYASGATDVPVWSVGEDLRYVERHLTHVFSTGVKPVFRLTTASGRTLRATANHPFLTYDGWRALGDLTPGTRIAAPRHTDGPTERTEWEDARVVMLAHLLGDGSFVRRQPIRYASVDEHNLAAVTVGGFVPQAVFALPKVQIALFLKHLWSTGGRVSISRDRRTGSITLPSTSRRLVDDVARLLLRFGITGRIRGGSAKGHKTSIRPRRQGYVLEIAGTDDQRRFLQEIGVEGECVSAAASLLRIIRARKVGGCAPVEPTGIWDEVTSILADKQSAPRPTSLSEQLGGPTLVGVDRSVARMGQIARVLDRVEMDVLAVNDVFWDKIISVEPDGEEEVFDATVLGNHNFIANGLAVHNSIEQDADMVVLLHREDLYNKESEKAGSADIMVAKHRNGPTKNIEVAFQGHYSRFSNMAPDGM
ncbi:replicative DNA helicase [Tersicoccus phoenicis]|uniref:replicative DNA helicase n=1 Tax=Tersicoccus phoenicis TaxID=554083 RepID=UPI000A0733B2|nr:replicative DNA helicase [Tersicoccus phoenicis]